LWLTILFFERIAFCSHEEGYKLNFPPRSHLQSWSQIWINAEFLENDTLSHLFMWILAQWYNHFYLWAYVSS
jgi:hypothetical protein